MVLVYLSALLAAAIWAFSFIWYKEVLQVYKPVSLVLVRLIISSVLLVLLGLLLGKLKRMKRKDVGTFFLLSLFSPFLYFLGESHGVNNMPATLAAVVIATIPLFSPIGAFFFLKERITLTNLIGIAISVVGVSMVVFYKGFVLADVNPVGFLYLFGAVAAAIGHALLVRKLGDNYNSFSIVTYQNSIGVLLFLPVFFITDYNHFMAAKPTWDVVVPLLCLGVFASTIAFVSYTFAIKNLGVSKTTVFTNTIPVFTAFLAFFILGEELNFVKILGILVVIAGLFFSQMPKSKLGQAKGKSV